MAEVNTWPIIATSPIRIIGITFKRTLSLVLKFPVLLLFFPLFLLYKSIKLRKLKGTRGLIIRFVLSVFVLLILFPIWVIAYFAGGVLVPRRLGYLPETLYIAGTGSMYPTFPKGQNETFQEQVKEKVAKANMFRYPGGLVIFGKRLFGRTIGRGDLVAFENQKIKELTKSGGTIKRVIALPGDSIELRNGWVYLSGKILNEPYIAKSRSTFGGISLSEYQNLTIPEDKLFIMGDNREITSDSRGSIGLISYTDISHVLPSKSQKDLFDENLRQGKESELIEKGNLTKEEEVVEIALLEPLMETDDWKTFTNQAGWSIKYPPDWGVRGCSYCTMEDLMDPEGYVSFSPPRPSGESLPLGYYEAFLMISHLANKREGLSMKDWFEEISDTMIWPPHIREELVALNGLSGFMVLWRANSGDKYVGSWNEDIFLVYNETETFQLGFGGSEVHEKFEDYTTYPIYRQMISTFKFKTGEF